jgi:hypothetical protein
VGAVVFEDERTFADNITGRLRERTGYQDAVVSIDLRELRREV